MIKFGAMPTTFTQIESPVGPLLLAADDTGLRAIEFINGRHSVSPDPAWHEDPNPLQEPIRQLRAYFAENLRLSTSPRPPGHNVSTRRLAQPMRNSLRTNHLLRRTRPPPRQSERLASSRAGERSNPIPIVIPCHRVIGSNGKLTGYGGGLPIKEKLLALERRQLRLL